MFGFGLVCDTSFSEVLGWILLNKELIYQAMFSGTLNILRIVYAWKNWFLTGIKQALVPWNILPGSIVCIPEYLCHPVTV